MVIVSRGVVIVIWVLGGAECKKMSSYYSIVDWHGIVLITVLLIWPDIAWLNIIETSIGSWLLSKYHSFMITQAWH